MDAIKISNFTKRYQTVQAVDQISFTVNSGELYGLIGPDGAGKTTLLRAICTLLVPDQGSILVNGLDTTKQIALIRSQIGYMPQRFSLYQDLTVAQNLKFFAELFQVPAQDQERRLNDLYKFSRLTPFKDRQAGALSGGMKQKLALSCALIHTPGILILDEPTFGVDPVSRDEFWQILHTIKKSGTTILVSTAYMNEADLCDRVALLFDGQIKAIDKPKSLRKHFYHILYKVITKEQTAAVSFFRTIPEIHSLQKFGDSLHISFDQNPTADQWERWNQKSGGNLISWEQIDPTIEDIFLEKMEKN